MSFALDKKYYGQVMAHVSVLESQKRGLRMQIASYLLKKSRSSNCRTQPASTNSFVQFPPLEDGELCQIELNHAIHAPCEGISMDAIYLEEEVYRELLPNPFSDEMARNWASFYVTYNYKVICKRKTPAFSGDSVQRTVFVRQGSLSKQLHKSSAVPYGTAIFRTLSCHINAELCISHVGDIECYYFMFLVPRFIRDFELWTTVNLRAFFIVPGFRTLGE